MKIEGARELEALLNKLPERLARNVTQAGLRAGGRVIAKQAKANLRADGAIDTGLTEEKIGVRARKGKAQVAVRAGAQMKTRKGKSKPELVRPSRYAHLIEFGSRTQPARAFMRPAVDEAAPEAIRKIGEVMSKGVDREARALAGGKKSFRTGRKV